MLFSSFISKCFGRIEATYFYSKKVHLYYANPKNVGSLDKNSLDTGTGIVGAPACGDVMKLQIKVDENGKITDAKFKTFGCGSAIAMLAADAVQAAINDYKKKQMNLDVEESQYSSQENLASIIGDMRIRDRFDSNESYACCLGDDFGGLMRPRSRSLTSPVPHLFERLGVDSPMMLSSVYKERFPKAKLQMENCLMQFLTQNAQLSGFTSQMLQLNIVPPSPMPTREQQQQSSSLVPPSPRPQSPNLLTRPLSPLVTESATAIGDSVIHHRSSNTNFLSAGSAGGFSPGNSFFGGQQQQLLNQGLDGGNGDQLSNNTPPIITSSTISSSPLFGCSTNSPPIDTQLLRLISDGATRFLHHQLCEIAADCLQKSRDDLLNCVYFCSMSVRLVETLAEAEMKVGPESYKYLFRLVKQMLMIVSRTARLLECLEFNPDEFYQLLRDAEVAVREQLGSGSARVPDLPQYILTKLGLNKNLSSLEKNIGEQTGDGEGEEEENEEEFR
uniref:Iron-sulfur cluster assembly scaffold protein n=1 Tax=Meloidogyne javanica TaxID=6303 RepID=A0A915MZ55_MELJA